MKKQQHSDHYSNWQIIIDIQNQRQLSTKTKIDITSYGDWGLAVYERDANKVDRPMYEIMREKEARSYYGPAQKMKFKVQNHLHLTNIKQAFEKITVQVGISEEEFKNRYGFWEINDFTVYNRDGNYCSYSFRTKDKFYYGIYATS